MLKILQTSTTGRQVGFLLLALVLVLPCGAAPPTLKTLYNFTGTGDGGTPMAGLVLGSGGGLFGTTSYGGTHGWGSVFELIPKTGGGWTEATLYSFTGAGDGAIPLADLTIGKSNVVYGTTEYGGTYGFGTVFALLPAAGGAWTEKVLYSFKGGTDGANPVAGLALASTTGVLYGTTYNGGTAGLGTIFQAAPSQGGTWSEKVLYSFQGGTDGANPVSDLVIGANTTLYGTTSQGGSVTIQAGTGPCPPNSQNTPCVYANWGTVFQLTTKGGGTWTEALLYTFLGLSDGGTPESKLIIGAGNVLYGGTFWGGSPTVCPVGGYPQGCGTVYSLTPPTGGGSWTQAVLHTFTGVSPDGSHPYGNLTVSTAGIIYGTTLTGGLQDDFCFDQSYNGCGTIFSMKPPTAPGGTWTKSNVTVFNGTNGGAPNGIILGSTGTLYGTTSVGGSAGGFGTVFSFGQ